MNENLSKLFKQTYNHPEGRLSDDIWYAIQTKQAKSLKIQSLVYGIIGILSLGCFVFMIFYMKKQFTSSGFFQYVSLIFSDGNLFASYWKEYLLSLADSLPVASLGASVFLLVSILISVRKLLKQYKNQLLSI
ncbi:MAG: hypothetical protein WCI91_00550 [Candidatus Nomurabacteria bacterium]